MGTHRMPFVSEKAINIGEKPKDCPLIGGYLRSGEQSSQRHNQEAQDIFATISGQVSKAKKKREKAPRRVQSTDPQEWLMAPWQSLHDGMQTCKTLAFKWNDQVPIEQKRQWTMYDSTLRRNK